MLDIKINSFGEKNEIRPIFQCGAYAHNTLFVFGLINK
jgi:hypothetical protein